MASTDKELILLYELILMLLRLHVIYVQYIHILYIYLKHALFALLLFIAEIFNNTSSEILHRAYEKWCDEMSISSDSSCDA